VGQSQTASGTRAFLWTAGTMMDLGTLPGSTSTFALDLNKVGSVVGVSANASNEDRAVLWTNHRLEDRR
jgi:probable HAF family extracellular repeat protein